MGAASPADGESNGPPDDHDRVTELAFKLLDDNASQQEFEQLETLLLNDAILRRTYIKVMNLESSMFEIFRTMPG